MKLSKLKIDSEGRLVLRGNKIVPGSPVGRPHLVWSPNISGTIGEFQFDEKYAMREIGKPMAPKGANAYVLGESQVKSGGTEVIYRAVQFYKI
ncbi:MAG: hypothetical protein NT129_05245 [Candidatus Aenigmarchaeota archaeon]|nr:hypothetical protein [Candidatus Aenigmarchaeota archaeon]